jgi:hypothetical protein
MKRSAHDRLPEPVNLRDTAHESDRQSKERPHLGSTGESLFSQNDFSGRYFFKGKRIVDSDQHGNKKH